MYGPLCLSFSSPALPANLCTSRRSVAVMQDEGQLEDRLAGSPANDGTWHHIALTWQSSDGVAKLYDNGRKVGIASSKEP